MSDTKPNHVSEANAAYLLTPTAIRERCGQVFALAQKGELAHFALDEGKLADVALRVAEVTKNAYPSLDIPYHARWRHFSVGGKDRAKLLDERIADRDERARAKLELAITSVLLDAGAGDAWRYIEHDAQTGAAFARSEGLAVASFHMFAAGAFSSAPSVPLRADAAGLAKLTAHDVATHFQVSGDNPLVGLEGRAALLTKLGAVAKALPGARVGGLYDLIARHAHAHEGSIAAARVLGFVLEHLSPIWPGRITLAGKNLGDTWRHSRITGIGETNGLVPFHKLSQWLTYSLVEPLEDAGLRVTDLDGLTGLPEYRNGGLFVDAGVLVPKRTEILERAFAPGDEVIVEWRALTIVLLDRIAPRVREALGKSAAEFPLAKVLEGGTWATGRELARQKRKGGGPPIRIESDGTVF